jgi:hypothetical protein
VEDVSADGGTRRRQTDREITFEAQVYGDDADMLYELDQLGVTDPANLNPIEWQVGDTMTDGSLALAHRVEIPAFEHNGDQTFTKLATSGVWSVSGTATGQSQGSEFALYFL